MRITGKENVKIILKELGYRIKQYRISLGLTQAEMAEKCGISPSTQTRVENGADSMASNYIRILCGFNIAENLEVVIPDGSLDLKLMYEKMKPRQRVRQCKPKPKSKWIWGEDKRKKQ